MPRTARVSVGGICDHVLNRGNARRTVFYTPGITSLSPSCWARPAAAAPLRGLAYGLMPNHFHLALRPERDGDLSAGLQWFLTAHVRRYHAHYRTTGHVWQGRFKAFPIQDDDHLLTAPRSIERDPVRAGLAGRRGA